MHSTSFFAEVIEYIKNNKPNKDKLSKAKVKLCAKHKMKKIPTDIEILLHAEKQDLAFLKKYLYTKPTRTISGVAVVAIMSKPYPCPHGKCSPCPGGPKSEFGTVPQSYTGNEPATMRAIRNKYDSYLQIFNRLEQYVVLGQNPEKVELIIMGGTFPSFPKKYQEEFVYYAFKAMNDFSKLFYKKIKGKEDKESKEEFDILKFREFFELPGEVGSEKRTKNIHKKALALKNKNKKNIINLEAEQKLNEISNIRCVGMTIETRPDYAQYEHANEMLRLGCTRVELGVQSVYDEPLENIERGHDVHESIIATRTLKDLGFKINYHMMLGLPGIDEKKDLAGLKELFKNSDFQPDMLKLYPCMVLKGTKLFADWKKGKYIPLTTEKAAKIISEFKKSVPEYVRIMRVQRDIPTKMTLAGVDRTNLRQLIQENMKKENIQCKCIRCREIKQEEIKGKVSIKINKYPASQGEEYFISAETKNNNNIHNLIGFCRLRFPSQNMRTETQRSKASGVPKENIPLSITKNSALIRELHVYGSAVHIGSKGKKDSGQHKGFGKKLMQTAEQIAKRAGKNKIVVISGVGVRDYYRKLGYKKQGPYMIKNI
ncbi:MAG: tRNA uridine(34) 5-carboxymethylaminomethyl modification radical SAM/GNAT enzyme Elp3 [Nanoarchaeota archaeon]|nr:tRNA uridine(34) 5-carboxymethylaminomethyl modification radical SAM/GNAT enzyme Elp3 [Nanoarchaeota archaeon]MBU1321805.1 tRNA uridine(34) 5-carboxymethylaminomethyl modification radical SAM/GNAT enzyme Elp3 [Nanoarchaeota archaeon]MBU1598252.1 tRNA uridine(34) 5-carboxymethylaminomethyl modification radical SAM/GNAT enzyme Elp3 [Nanoarchaeota archaeon]MBU2441719.1 tRNA uridine(34) 5-carboxymethylaminomethyl modification radical SAM/GNAT enzyme Elp3 [Nanoarchaeota archaeon]